jgi:hypothetical protein
VGRVLQVAMAPIILQACPNYNVPLLSTKERDSADLEIVKEHIDRRVRPVLPRYPLSPTNTADSDIAVSQNMGNRMSR